MWIFRSEEKNLNCQSKTTSMAEYSTGQNYLVSKILEIFSDRLDVKVPTFWEKHKIWKNLPHGCDKSADLLRKHQNQERDFSNFACFSKSPNFMM